MKAIEILEKHFAQCDEPKLKLAWLLVKKRAKSYEHDLKFIAEQAEFLTQRVSIHKDTPLFEKE